MRRCLTVRALRPVLAAALLAVPACGANHIDLVPLTPESRTLRAPAGAILTIRPDYAARDRTVPGVMRGERWALAVYLVVRADTTDLVLPIYYLDADTTMPEMPGASYHVRLPDGAEGHVSVRLRALWVRAPNIADYRAAWQSRLAANAAGRWQPLRALQPDRNIWLARPRHGYWEPVVTYDITTNPRMEREFIVGPDRTIRERGLQGRLNACGGVVDCLANLLERVEVDRLSLSFTFANRLKVTAPLHGVITCEQLEADSLLVADAALKDHLGLMPPDQHADMQRIIELATAATRVVSAPSAAEAGGLYMKYLVLSNPDGSLLSQSVLDARARLDQCFRDNDYAPTMEAAKFLFASKDAALGDSAEQTDELLRPLVGAMRQIDTLTQVPFAKLLRLRIAKYEDRVAELRFRRLWAELEAYPDPDPSTLARFDSANAALGRLTRAREWQCATCTARSALLRARFDSTRTASLRFSEPSRVLVLGQRDTLEVDIRARSGTAPRIKRNLTWSLGDSSVVSVIDGVVDALEVGETGARVMLEGQESEIKLRVLDVESIRLYADGSPVEDTLELHLGDAAARLRGEAVSADKTVLPCPIAFSADVPGARIFSLADQRMQPRATGVGRLIMQCERRPPVNVPVRVLAAN